MAYFILLFYESVMIMSDMSSIHIKFSTEYSYRDILNSLLSHGWRVLDDKNNIFFLPIGDKGDYDWQEHKLTLEDLLILINTKEKNKEPIGVIIYFGEIGCQLLTHYEHKEEIDFLLNINKKYLLRTSSYKIIDVNWYLERTLKFLLDDGFKIFMYAFEEVY